VTADSYGSYPDFLTLSSTGVNGLSKRQQMRWTESAFFEQARLRSAELGSVTMARATPTRCCSHNNVFNLRLR
jgi:hypothetical protein